MREEYLPEFGGAYLEDSYFLGVIAEGRNLRLKFLFALTADHADHTAAKSGEQHCYREGSILIVRPSILEWRAGAPAVTRDLDGTFDFGSIQLYRNGASHFRFVTEWFDVTVKSELPILQLSDVKD